MMKISHKTLYQQRGVAAVEFAIIAMLLFTLLFGIIEFGRLFYVFNTVQEVTRRAAREAVVSCVDNPNIRRSALFGGDSLLAGGEIALGNINIAYLNASNAPVTTLPTCPAGNVSACLLDPTNCVAFVQVSITTGTTYAPMVGLFPFLAIPIPASTVTMPAESLGFRLN